MDALYKIVFAACYATGLHICAQFRIFHPTAPDQSFHMLATSHPADLAAHLQIPLSVRSQPALRLRRLVLRPDPRRLPASRCNPPSSFGCLLPVRSRLAKLAGWLAGFDSSFFTPPCSERDWFSRERCSQRVLAPLSASPNPIRIQIQIQIQVQNSNAISKFQNFKFQISNPLIASFAPPHFPFVPSHASSQSPIALLSASKPAPRRAWSSCLLSLRSFCHPY